MAKTYVDKAKRETVFEPNISRQRIAYKGVIPSHVLNLYYDQFVVDCARLAKQAEQLEASLYQISQNYSNVFDTDTPDYYIDSGINATIYLNYTSYNESLAQYSSNSATPYNNSVYNVNKQMINSSKISRMIHKLSMLEDLIGKKE